MVKKITYFSIEHPKLVITLTLIFTFIFLFQIPSAIIDTDPENMLEENQSDRVYYDQVKEDFGIRDMIVLGITDEEGVFRPEFLGKLEYLTNEILNIEGIVVEDVISFSTTDNVISEDGTMKVNRIMKNAPQNSTDTEKIRLGIYDNPLFIEKIVSKNGNAIAMYLPIEQKDMSYRISEEIETILEKEIGEGQNYYIAGLPVAEDTFGFEMFLQMGILAPLAGLLIFLLMLLLFKKVSLVIPAMIVAMFSIVWGMGALIGLGFKVHIMSSMIPIFLMPIAVLDSVHILSEFKDRYRSILDRKKTLYKVIDELSTPMLFTSLTTAFGFGSLMLANIPPIRVFGAFVAFGVMAAWLLTITFIPAFIMLTKEEKLIEKFAQKKEKPSFLTSVLTKIGKFAFHKNKRIVLGAIILLAIGVWGLTKIVVNDNPVKWFKSNHKIRIADRVMNQNFGGTYMAYLTVEGQQPDDIKRPEVLSYIHKLQNYLSENEIVGKTTSIADIVNRVGTVLNDTGNQQNYIPDDQNEIGQYLFLFQMSGDPNELDNLVDYEFKKANIWIQMKSGDNKDMEEVEKITMQFFSDNKPPEGIEFRWSGLAYINKVWQDLMVNGMAKAILGGFGAVLLLMIILFRSPGLAFLSMLPLIFAIALSYGLIGFVGKDYDMPIAVVSSLALGLSIDFAIHFIQRYRQKYKECKNLKETNDYIFQEPARAISRNVLVITFGFLPLMFATLGPYITVGTFFIMLMPFSGLTTLILLPALMRIVGHRFIKKSK